MKPLITALALFILAGCTSSGAPTAEQQTWECMNYHAMMTAPMAPDAMQRLKAACEQSRLR